MDLDYTSHGISYQSIGKSKKGQERSREVKKDRIRELVICQRHKQCDHRSRCRHSMPHQRDKQGCIIVNWAEECPACIKYQKDRP